MDAATDQAISWLLDSDEPAVAVQARCDLLGERVDHEVALGGAKVRTLLSDQQADGGFGGHPYQKWHGTHWRLVSLVDLGIPPGEPRAMAALERELTWLTGRNRLEGFAPGPDGRTRVCASMEGNGLAVACRLGLADDSRVEDLVRHLVGWQWPDGGWNCAADAKGHRSSFHESWIPMWGLYEYADAATGPLADEARAAAERTAELLLDHHVYRTADGAGVINRAWLSLRYPAYWHYGVLPALVVLARMGHAADPRAEDAIDRLRQRRLPDGRWQPGAYWWGVPGGTKGPYDVVDWGRGGPNEHITLNALRVLAAVEA